MAVKPYEKGERSSRGLPGMYLLKPGSKMRLYQPSYNKGITLFRPWGDINKEGTAISMSPWRDSDGCFGTSWFVRDSIINGWGKDRRFTAFTEVSDPENWPHGSPFELFYDDMRSNDQFAPLMKRMAGSFSPVSAPSNKGFIKGVLIENAGKSYRDNPIWGVILMMSKSAYESIDALVNEPAGAESPEFADDPYGYNAKYAVGDPIGFETGAILELAKEGTFDAEAADQAESAGVNLNGSGSGSSGGRDRIPGYEVRLWPKCPRMAIEDRQRALRSDQKFEDCFQYFTGEEQIVNCLVPAFEHSAPEALRYTFGNKGLLPASIEGGKKVVDMGADTGAPKKDYQQAEDPGPGVSINGTSKPAASNNAGFSLGGTGDNPTTDDSDSAETELPFDTDDNKQEASAQASEGSTAQSIRERMLANRNRSS